MDVSNPSSRCKATSEQLNHLAEYMKNHPALASGLGQSLQGRVEHEKAWAKLAAELNALGGPIKTTAKWKQAWRDMRSNVKRKAAHNRSEYRGYGTGNGPSTIMSLTPAEEQVLSVLGPVAVYGMEEIMSTEVNPESVNVTCPISPTNCIASLPTSEMAPLAVPSTSQDPPPAAAPSSYIDPSPAAAPSGSAEVKREATNRKRKRLTKGVDSFDNKLLKLEEEKLDIKKQRLQVEMEKLQAKRERTDVLIRLLDVLKDISNKLDK